MKNKEILTVIVFVIIAAIVGTFAINEAYKFGCGYVTKWVASDMLIFFGTVLGGLSTLLAVYATIKDGDKKRKKDKSDSENRERHRFFSKILFETLCNLDNSYLLNFKNIVDRKERTPHGINDLRDIRLNVLLPPQKLSDLIETANKNKNMEIYFSSDEEAIFHDTLTRFREYRAEYVSLLDHFKRNGYFAMDAGIIESDEINKIEPLCSVKYNELVASVHESLKKIGQRGI